MSNGEQPGLRLRLAHEAKRIASQHHHLHALELTTRRSVERGDREEMQAALLAYRGALDAHFDLEEQVHFPALHGLAPALRAQLDELTRDHQRIRAELDRLAQALADGDAVAQRAALLPALANLAADLRTHETREETLLAEATQR